MDDPLSQMEDHLLSEPEILAQNLTLLASIKDFLEKTVSCFKHMQTLDSSKPLQPLAFIFCMRLFEKARFNLCQANYSARQIQKQVGDKLGEAEDFKITRRLQEFEAGKLGKQGSIKACLRSVQFMIFGNKQANNIKSSYE